MPLPPTAYLGLTPDPDPARSWVRAELARSEYQPTLYERVRGFILDRFNDLIDGARHVGQLSTPVALALLIAIVALLVVVLSRLRPAARRRREPVAVFDEERADAAAHRLRARRALDEARFDDALVEAMRAIASGLIERDLLSDLPSLTAREVTSAAQRSFPGLAERLESAVVGFDAVRYGDRHADRGAAEQMLALVRDLQHAQPDAEPIPTTAGTPWAAVPR